MKFFVLALIGFVLGLSPVKTAESPATDPGRDGVTSLAAFNVKADRFEDFGFRVSAHLGGQPDRAFRTSTAR